MADIAKLIYKENTLYGWESGDIKSSNDTYDDIVFLTQAEYDALPSKNPNTLYSTPEGWPAGFDSSNVKAFPLCEPENWMLLSFGDKHASNHKQLLRLMR